MPANGRAPKFGGNRSRQIGGAQKSTRKRSRPQGGDPNAERKRSRQTGGHPKSAETGAGRLAGPRSRREKGVGHKAGTQTRKGKGAGRLAGAQSRWKKGAGTRAGTQSRREKGVGKLAGTQTRRKKEPPHDDNKTTIIPLDCSGIACCWIVIPAFRINRRNRSRPVPEPPEGQTGMNATSLTGWTWDRADEPQPNPLACVPCWRRDRRRGLKGNV